MLEMAVSGSLNEDLTINGDNLKTNIKNGLGNNDFEFTDNNDGSYKVKINSSNRLYYIEENGNIISEEKMLKISSADELKAFRDEVNSGNTYDGWYIYLTNDITLDINEEWESIGYYSNESSSPNSELNNPFSGIFDGSGYEINGININNYYKVQGFFGLVNNGKILNLGIGEQCKFNLKSGASAGIVGYLCNNSIIRNCYNNSSIIASENIMIGGIVGQVYNKCKIENCYNMGDIQALAYIGGITGNLDNLCEINNCYNTGKVIAFGTTELSSYSSCGGIVGAVQNNSNVNNCYNIGNIDGYKYVGGIIGQISVNSYNNIKNCYSLNDTVNDGTGSTFDGTITGLVYYVNSNELKNIQLSNIYKEDTNNINNGYPILYWQ